ncbi:hypothetical protein ABIG06_000769 [Bradyrhizobium sp. USDA 326]
MRWHRTPRHSLSKTRFLHANRKTTSLENALEYQPACKPGSVGHRPLARTIRDGHSSGTVFAHGLEQPTRTASLTSPRGVIAFANSPLKPSLFGFAPGGVCHAGSVAGTAVRSYRTFSPLPTYAACAATARQARGLAAPKPLRAKAGGSFSVALSLGSPPPDVIRHRMSREPGLSSPAAFRHLPERPSGRLTDNAWAFVTVSSSRYRSAPAVRNNLS